MADSGRVLGDCRHGRTPEWCLDCLRAEVERLTAELADQTDQEDRQRNRLIDAVAAEREACARVAEERMTKCGRSDCRCWDGHHVAAGIRARGEVQRG